MRDRKGFTLIELLIVVVIIGILAAIAIPKFAATRERAFVSAMKSDLKNLASQQEIYYSDPVNNYTYSSLLADPNLGFTPSEGVTITLTAGATGWGASAVHEGLQGGAAVTCALFFGDDFVTAPAQFSGALECTVPGAL